MEPKYDFFISYNKADTQWAEWIAWQLEEAGYTTRIQIWDFGAGSNFALEMHQAAIEAARTIAVLSPYFLKSEYCAPEWVAAFVHDPAGKKRKLLPVRIQECSPQGLLAAVDYIDLVGIEEVTAKNELLSRIEKALLSAKGKRAKPDSPPDFPGYAVAAERSQPRFPATLPPIWRVPYNRNPNFIGRETELAFLQEQLKSGTPAALTQAISGLGGVGKTQLALEYTYRNAGDYDLVWWVRSEEPATLAGDIADLAAPLKLHQADIAEQESKIQAVLKKLGQMIHWLLVFDNAAGPEDISSFLPQGSGGQIIITSRNDVWQRLARKVEIKTFNREESIMFLIERTGQRDEAAANRLANELGDLPLALEQTGAYIEETGRELSDYFELFRIRRNDLLKSQPAPSDYHGTVLTTWDLSMQQVSKESSEAISLLNLFSFLSPDDIPRMLLAEIRGVLPEPFFQTIADPLIQDKAVASLKRYSLVELSLDGFFIHRLVQAVVREHLSLVQQESYCKAAFELISAAMPSETADPASWPIYGRLAPHALAVWEHAQDLKIADEATACLLDNFGLYFFYIAEYQNAKPVLEEAFEIRNNILGEEHPDTAKSLNNLGLLSKGLGDYVKARKCYDKALEIRRKVLGEEHPDTAKSLNNLGLLLQASGNYSAVKPCYEQALEILRKVLGEEHRDTATSLHNLGFLLQAMGDYEKAMLHYEQALKIRRKVLGEEHPDTAGGLNSLGSLLQLMGDYAAALPYYEQALAINRKVLGDEHPNTAINLNNLGFLLQLMSDYEEARPYYEQALAINLKVLGKEHPDTAGSLNSLGSLLQLMGDYAAALPYYEQALAINRKVLGDEHPNTATNLNNLGILLQLMGDYKAAQPPFEEALAINRKVLGKEHPDTAGSFSSLGSLLQAMGDYTAAKPYYEKALEIRRKVLGEEHPTTAASFNNLGFLLDSMGDYKEALPYYEKALDIFRKVLGEEHPDTATSLNNLGFLLQTMGDLTAARPYYEKALEISREVLGEEHPNTATSLNNLGFLLRELGDYAGARPYYEQALKIRRKVLGEEHPDTATSFNNLAILCFYEENLQDAEDLINRAIMIRDKILGSQHPDTVSSRKNLTLMMKKMQQK
jgi:tetratricopeptide (TPR) repeat protein